MPASSVWPARLALALLLVVLSSASVLLWRQIDAVQQQRIDERIGYQARSLARQLESTLHLEVANLERIARLWNSLGRLPRASWNEEVELTLRGFPVYQSIQWVGADLHMRWLLPVAGNEAALDFTLAPEHPNYPLAMEARDSGEQRFSGSVELVQGGRGFVLYTPLYRMQEGTRVFDGFLQGVFRVEPLMLQLHDHEYLIAVSRDNSERLQLEAQLQRLSQLDGLTGLYNRRYFDQQLLAEWRRLRRLAAPLALLMLDIDYFKPYNDALGHLAGDDALRKVSAALRESLQREGDTACRYGGEEFAIILANTHQEGAEQVAASIHAAIASLDIKHPSSPLGRLTLSIGITVVDPVIDEQPGELLAQADQALYHAKHEGRNRTCRWQPPVLDLHQAT